MTCCFARESSHLRSRFSSGKAFSLWFSFILDKKEITTLSSAESIEAGLHDFVERRNNEAHRCKLEREVGHVFIIFVNLQQMSNESLLIRLNVSLTKRIESKKKTGESS